MCCCLKNQDTVPQTFGPALLMPGQSFRLPFEVASDYQFACTAHSERTNDYHRRPVSGLALGPGALAGTKTGAKAFGNKTHEPTH